MARNPAQGSFPQRIRRREEEIRRLRLRGTPSGAAAIVTIAASNTAAAKRDLADYVCTGTDDQNTLAQALQDGFTHYLLLPGDFYFTGSPWRAMADTASWLSDDIWTTTTGSGRATRIHVDLAFGAFAGFTPCYAATAGAEISNMAIILDGPTSYGILALTFAPTDDRLILKDLYFTTAADPHVFGGRQAIQTAGNAVLDNIVLGNCVGMSRGIVSSAYDVLRGIYLTGTWESDFECLLMLDGDAQLLNSVMVGADCGTFPTVQVDSDDVLIQGCTITDSVAGSDVDISAGASDTRLVGNKIGVLTP